MSIFRVHKTDGYTVVSNHILRNANASLKAKGLLVWMLSCDSDWNFSLAGMSKCLKEGEDAIKSALDELTELGYVKVTKLMPGTFEDGSVRNRISYEYDIYEEPISQPPNVQGVEVQCIETPLQRNTKRKEILNKEGQDKPVSLSKHSRSFRKDVEALSDDLVSQQEIQAQKKERKKQSNYDKCIAYIDELNYSDEIKDLLRRFFIQSYNSNASERVSDVKRLQSRIKKLDKFIANKEDPAKIIQQSIDLEWHSFWSVKDSTTTKRKSFEGLADSVVSTLSSEERQKKMDEKRRLVAEGKLKVY